tara:strand:+ start:2488 stop:2973 length:486 start_codon:yes stop_codon:yes gene_type:complete
LLVLLRIKLLCSSGEGMKVTTFINTRLIKKTFLLLIVFSFFSLSAESENVFYCTSELATGFVKENNVWKTNDFELERWTIKFNSDYTKAEGLTAKPMNCQISYSFKPNMIFCVHDWGSHESLIFNKKDLRFELSISSSGGYIENSPNPDTSSFYAGRCQKF